MKRIDAEKKELSYLFRDFWFIVPEYQRPYVWNKDNILELLEDLWLAFTRGENDEYFVGSLVLGKLNDSSINEYEILDGQQRLTTFLLIFNTFKKQFKEDIQLKNTLTQFLFQENNPYRYSYLKVAKISRYVSKAKNNSQSIS